MVMVLEKHCIECWVHVYRMKRGALFCLMVSIHIPNVILANQGRGVVGREGKGSGYLGSGGEVFVVTAYGCTQREYFLYRSIKKGEGIRSEKVATMSVVSVDYSKYIVGTESINRYGVDQKNNVCPSSLHEDTVERKSRFPWSILK